jgi:hypothetical protein
VIDTKAAADREAKRILSLLDDMDERHREAVTPLVTNAAWMKVKLDQTRLILMNAAVVMNYDNGGGQTGVRKNPAFDAYNSLISQYAKCIRQLCDMMPEGGGRDELAEWAKGR